jgi:hypothetical protein
MLNLCSETIDFPRKVKKVCKKVCGNGECGYLCNGITNINTSTHTMKSKIIHLYDRRTNEEMLNEFLSTITKEQIVSVNVRDTRDGQVVIIIYSV